MTDMMSSSSCNNIKKDESEEENAADQDWDEEILYEHCYELLHQSRTHLMLREFSECLNICMQGLRECSRHSTDRKHCCFESFVILAVQAYGEQTLWREVLPFIDKIYGDVQKYPPTIMKLCIGLLSWVGEYSLAQKQAGLWLEDTTNKLDIEQHTDVGRVVIEKILIPQKKYEEINCLLVKLDGMMEPEKESIQKWIDRMYVAMEQRRSAEKNSKDATQFDKGVSQNLLQTIVLRMRNFLFFLPSLMKHSVGKVIFIGLSFYLVFLHLKMSDAILGSSDITHFLFQIYSLHFKR